MAGRTPAGIFCNGVFNLFWLHLCRQGCKGKGDICLPAQSLPLPRGGVSEADGQVDGTKHSNADSVCTVGTDLPGGPNIRTVFKTDRRGRRSLQCEKGLPYSHQAKKTNPFGLVFFTLKHRQGLRKDSHRKRHSEKEEKTCYRLYK